MTRAEQKYPIDNYLPWDTHEKSLQLARREGYEQAEKDLIEKAVTWWSNNLVEREPTKGYYISAFKKYMENK